MDALIKALRIAHEEERTQVTSNGPSTVLQLRKELIDEPKTNSRQYDGLEISSFYVTKKTVIKEEFVKVVDQQSALLHLLHEQQTPLHRDHRTICQFSHKEHEDYKQVRKQLERWSDLFIAPVVACANALTDVPYDRWPKDMKITLDFGDGMKHTDADHPVMTWGS
ncbi:hypothetical protein DFH27DRAFT_618602 [Peziza echinospora]|nr:hypothetical protein DFH27DRAFT_618602 [Peziza echinospora]